MPSGLFEPDSWRKVRWMRVRPAIMKGRRKCSAKNRVNVGLVEVGHELCGGRWGCWYRW